MSEIKIAALTAADLVKFNNLYYDDLLVGLPSEEVLLGAIKTDAEKASAVGLLMGHVRDDVLYIDWLFVDKDERGKTAGSKLLNTLTKALDTDPESPVSSVMTNFDSSAEGLAEFLRKFGFGVYFSQGSYNVSAKLKDIKLIGINKEGTATLKSVPLTEVSEDAWARFDHYLDNPEVQGVCVTGQINPKVYRPESRAVIFNGVVVAVILVGYGLSDFEAEIEWLYCMPKFVPHAVPIMYDSCIGALKENMPPNSIITLATINDAMNQFVDKLMPEAKHSEYYGAVWFVEAL